MADQRVERFRGWVRTINDGRYAREQQREMLFVASVEQSGGKTKSATGPIVQPDGSLSAAQFTVTMGGKAAAQGEFLYVGRPADQAVGAELVYIEHAESPYPGAGLVVIDADLPAPTNLVVTSELIVLPGLISARAKVEFDAVPAKYQPSGYTISFRVDGGPWADRHVPHIGGAQECVLGSDLEPGATIDVHARARYNYAGAESVPTADVSHTLAADTASAGSISALAVDVSVPNTIWVTPTASITPELFRGIQYEINDAATGTPDSTLVPVADAGPYPIVLPPGTYYIAARTVSRSGTLGPRFPSSGFQGPYVVIDQSANLDTIAPSGMGAPSLAVRSLQFADNTWHGFLTVTRPTYSPPADLAAYEISIVVDDGRAFNVEMPAGTTVWDGEIGFGEFTVAMRARDIAGNKPAFGATAVITNDPPEFLGAAPTVSTASRAAGIMVSWTPVTNAHHYEVQRATDSGGTGATTIGTADGLWFLDTLTANNLILPTYYYRARAIGVDDGTALNGAYSGWVAGSAIALDGQNLRALSITAAEIAADAITANKILAGAVTAAKLEADLILATKIRSATSGARFEIEGATGGGAAVQLRFYNASHQTALFDGSGLYFYGNNGSQVQDFSLARNGSGRGQLTMGAMSVGTDGTGPFILIPLTTTGGGGEIRFSGATASARLREQTFAGLNAVGFTKLNGTVGDPVLVLYDNVGGGAGNEKLALHWDGISSDNDSISPYEFRWSSGFWRSNIPHFTNWGTALGTTGGNTQDLEKWLYPSTSNMTMRLRAYRGQNGSGQTDARFRLSTDWNNEAAGGGGVQLGFRNATDPLWLLEAPLGTARMYWDHPNTRVLVVNGLRIDGALSKASGTFDIPHPDPDKNADGVRLRHSLVESPTRGDNLYRFAVRVTAEQVGQEIAVELPDYWPWLNEDGQCWCSPVRHFGVAWAEVRGDGSAFVLAGNAAGWYNVLIVGTRKDAAAVRGWDDTGGIEPQANEGDREREHLRRDARGRKIAPRPREI